MDKNEARRKMLLAFDDIAKGAIALIVSAVVTRLVDDTYDKFIVSRRHTQLEDPDA